jgi:hypothetical protein
MPFGLKGAASTFARLISTVLSGIQGIKYLVYLDGTAIFGEKLQVHKVLARMRKHNLKLQAGKCEFLRKKAAFCDML